MDCGASALLIPRAGRQHQIGRPTSNLFPDSDALKVASGHKLTNAHSNEIRSSASVLLKDVIGAGPEFAIT